MPLRYQYSKLSSAKFVEYYSKGGDGHVFDPEAILIQRPGPLINSIPQGRLDTIKLEIISAYLNQLK